MLGGPSASHPITPEVKALAIKHQKDIEAKLGKKFTTFTPVSYTEQVVAGMNYTVSIDIGGGHKVSAKIYKPLSGETQLSEAH